MEHNVDDSMAPEAKRTQNEVAKNAYALYEKEGHPQDARQDALRC